MLELLGKHSERILHNHEINPRSGVLPLDYSSDVSMSDSDEERAYLSQGRLKRQRSDPSSLRGFLCQTSELEFKGRVWIKVTCPHVNSPSEMKKLCPAGDGIYRFAIVISDGSFDVSVIVADKEGRQLFGMPAGEACGARKQEAFQTMFRNIRDRRPLLVDLLTVVMDESKFFVLKSVEEV